MPSTCAIARYIPESHPIIPTVFDLPAESILSFRKIVIGMSFGFWAQTLPAAKNRIPKTKHTLFFIRFKFLMVNKNKYYRRNENEQSQNNANDINGLICYLKVEPCFDSCGNEKDSP